MKKVLQKFVMLLCGSMLLLTSGSCGKADDKPKTGNTVKMITVAVVSAHPPYAFLENGEVTGIDVEILREIAKNKKLTFRFSDVLFENVFVNVSSDRYNIGIGGIAISEQRKKTVDFTSAYDEAPQVIIVMKNSALKSSDDLKKGKFRIGVSKGTVEMVYDALREQEVYELANHALAIKQALPTQKIDGFVCDEKIAIQLVKNEPDLVIVPWKGTNLPYGFAVDKRDTQILNALNEGIAELKDNGKLDQIKKKFQTAR